MATNVYITYDEMSDEERENVKTASDNIAGGAIGYVRATVWMEEENGVFREIFPKEVWESEGPIPFSFEESLPKFKETMEKYVRHEVERFNVIGDDEALMETIEQVADEQGGVAIHQELSDDERSEWLKAMVAFFRRGWELEKEGKNPRIEIKW